MERKTQHINQLALLYFLYCLYHASAAEVIGEPPCFISIVCSLSLQKICFEFWHHRTIGNRVLGIYSTFSHFAKQGNYLLLPSWKSILLTRKVGYCHQHVSKEIRSSFITCQCRIMYTSLFYPFILPSSISPFLPPCPLFLPPSPSLSLPHPTSHHCSPVGNF